MSRRLECYTQLRKKNSSNLTENRWEGERGKCLPCCDKRISLSSLPSPCHSLRLYRATESHTATHWALATQPAANPASELRYTVRKTSSYVPSLLISNGFLFPISCFSFSLSFHPCFFSLRLTQTSCTFLFLPLLSFRPTGLSFSPRDSTDKPITNGHLKPSGPTAGPTCQNSCGYTNNKITIQRRLTSQSTTYTSIDLAYFWCDKK